MPGVKLEDRIDVIKAYDLRFNKGLSYRQIGDTFAVSHQAVHQRLQSLKHLAEPQEVKAYENNKTSILSAVEHRLVTDLLEPDKRKKSSLYQTATSYGIIYDKNRLENGLSTENISINVKLEAISNELSSGRSVLDLLDQVIQSRDSKKTVVTDEQ